MKDYTNFENWGEEDYKSNKAIKALYNTDCGKDTIFDVTHKVLNHAKELGEDVEKKFLDYIKIEEERLRKKELENMKRREKIAWHMEVRKEELEKARKKKEERRKLIELKRKEENRIREYEEYKKSIEDAVGAKKYKLIVDKFCFLKDGSLSGSKVANYDLIAQNDLYIQEHVQFNEFTHCLEFDGVTFTNGNLLDIISYIDRVYHIHDDKLIWNALQRPLNVPSYHPIKDIIEFEKWDGTKRIDEFFKNVCGLDPEEKYMKDYLREVARMIFYGGIRRLYEPGCKFDYMIIFEGPQGAGKSTLTRLLAIDDSAYSEVTTINGQEGIENISGAWICEFAELLAMVKAREIEATKAFITRQFDKYRPPYARTAEVIPRACIFIGTTNDTQFMSDMTGNRRYLPVHLEMDAEKLFQNVEDVQKYILECWREALYLYVHNEIYTSIPAKYFPVLEKVRARYLDEDPLEGLIADYLSTLEVGYQVCSLEIYTKCCSGLRLRFTTRDSRKIATIMQRFVNWKRVDERIYFKDYGQQRYWVKMYDLK